MDTKTLGATIAELRKQHGMTQAELADKMGVTDKAVSKWERDLSCPDISSLPRLAELFGVSADELLRVKTGEKSKNAQLMKIADGALAGVALAMGVFIVVGSALGIAMPDDMIPSIGIGMTSLGILAVKAVNKN